MNASSLPDSEIFDLAIVGAGIGGLAAALAFTKQGKKVCVLEKATSGVANDGAGLHIWANGAVALNELGVLEKVLQNAPRQRVCNFVTHEGKALGAWNVAGLEAELGFPTLAVERSFLRNVLLDALPNGIVRENSQVTEVRDTGAYVEISHAHMKTRARVVVGADGVGSRVRKAIAGAKPISEHGYVAWRGRTETNRIAPGTFSAVFGPGQRFTFYDVAPGIVHWMSVLESDEDIDQNGPVIMQLYRRYQDWPSPIETLLRNADSSSILRHEVIDRSPESTWGSGRITLLGDAAHPITFNLGQGASQALEDALELCNQLKEVDLQAEVAPKLRAYEVIRMRRTRNMQRLARRIGSLGRLSSPPGVAFRNSLMRIGWDRIAWSGVKGDVEYAIDRFQNQLITQPKDRS